MFHVREQNSAREGRGYTEDGRGFNTSVYHGDL